MTQQINLFQPMFRRERQLLSAHVLLQCMAIVLAVIAAFVIVDRYRLQQLRLELAELTTSQLAAANELEAVTKQIKPKIRSELLARELAGVEEELAASRRAADAIATGVLGNTRGFSAFLAGLAKQHLDGVWITDLNILAGGTNITLRGQALAPALVAQFLQKLALELAFGGKQFSQLRLDRDGPQNRSVKFELSTVPDKALGAHGS